jgi:two-component system response regulator YesN
MRLLKTIGIVEDEYYFRQALKKYISEYPDAYQVVGEAGNGKAGLEMLIAQQPDIALVDITMPLMDGL